MPERMKWRRSNKKLPVKIDDQEEIDRLTKEFEDKGGVVQIIPKGISGEMVKIQKEQEANEN